ncbi:BldC family transcriptional regulator [Sphaerisporangium sp. NPDC005288]|uniref:BldC family transcriptional regulator n=1 Tax=Sphaerisporangium sp. NPDC005288 TaxID=3155114 RepID=UPI0033BCC2E6
MRIVADARSITEPLLTSAEVAAVFRVDPKTIARWAREGRIAGIRTPGGRLIRYRESDVRAALEVSVTVPEESAVQEPDGIAALAVSA